MVAVPGNIADADGRLSSSRRRDDRDGFAYAQRMRGQARYDAGRRRWMAARTMDVAAAAVAAGVGVVFLFDRPVRDGEVSHRSPGALGVALVLATTLPLVLHRRFAVPAAVVSVSASSLAGAIGFGFSLPLLVSLYLTGAAAYRTGWRTEIALGLFTIAALLAAFVADSPAGLGFQNVLALASAGALPAVLGHAMRTQRAHADAMTERARSLLELREIETRRAADQERMRVAREVHDLVGHFLAGITLQARAARKRIGADPEAARNALAEIDELASKALAETRQAVRAIRDRAVGHPPTLMLDDLDALVARLQSDDVDLRLRREPSEVIVPAELQTCAYRIAQEALSNVVRHAAPASATVTVGTSGGVLTIDVCDDGRAAGCITGGGIGLQGMRDRAWQAGGSLEAGPAPDGGWRVLARLPLRSGTST
jgi:signal transduction histidine kinase